MNKKRAFFFSLYWIFATITAFLTLAFFAYGLVHGASFMIVIFPLVLLFFALPLLLAKKLKSLPKGPRMLFWTVIGLPIAAVIAFVGYFFFLKPAYEKYVTRAALKEIEIQLLSEEPLIDSNVGPIGVRIRYAVTVRKQVPRLTEFSNLLPDAYLKVPGEENDNPFSGVSQTEVQRNGQKFNPALEELLPGTYEVVEDYLIRTLIQKEVGLCYSPQSEKVYGPGLDQALSRLTDTPLEVAFMKRVSLSGRMGFYDYHFPTRTLQHRYPISVMNENAKRFPPCDN